MADTAALRLARTLAAFRDTPPDQTIAATCVGETGVSQLSYGDLLTLHRDLVDAQERLAQIGDWHARETGPHGMVGDCCVECGRRWPCDSRQLAEGTHEAAR